jgi:hypothetical protein
MNKKVITILAILVILAVAVFACYKYLMTGGARNVAEETPAFTITAEQLALEFNENEPAAAAKYVNKTVVVSGNITQTEKNTIILNGSVLCTLNSTTANVQLSGGMLELKGRVVGYDDLMQEVHLDQCFITNTKL